MKATAILILVVGVVLLIGGIYGFVTLEGVRRPGDDDVDALRYLVSHLRGSINNDSQREQSVSFTMNCVNNRQLYSILGVGLIIIGGVIKKKAA
jgi:uncharacterized membrane protein HdeD (DUF308 family)